MFPQKNRMYHPYSRYPFPKQMWPNQQQTYSASPTRRPRPSLFRRPSQENHHGLTYGVPNINYRQQQPYFHLPQQQINQTLKQSYFRDEQGKIDFKKIGGGVQTVMGIANQVGPMMKMLGGFLK